jgi:lysophospholipase L1-like esterase
MMMTRQSHSTLIIVALVSGLLILHQVFSTTINSQQQLLQTEKKETPRLFPHILCLGDSLTEGYTSHGSQRHPYTNRLAERLENASYTASITQAGLSGDMVTEGFKPRLQRYYDSIDSIKYSLTIILGG